MIASTSSSASASSRERSSSNGIAAGRASASSCCARRRRPSGSSASGVRAVNSSVRSVSGTQALRDLGALVAEHRRAEAPEQQQVLVLLARDPVAAGDLVEPLLDPVRIARRPQLERARLGDVPEPVPGGRARELVEPHGRPEVRQLVVHEPVLRALGEHRDLHPEHPAVRVLGDPDLEELEQLARLLRLRGPGRLVARVPQRRLAQQPPQVAAGVRVVGDVGDAVRAPGAP